MKVYAVIERCADDFYSDYTVVDDCVYLKEEDAKKRLKEMNEDIRYWAEELEVYDFEVKD